MLSLSLENGDYHGSPLEYVGKVEELITRLVPLAKMRGGWCIDWLGRSDWQIVRPRIPVPAPDCLRDPPSIRSNQLGGLHHPDVVVAFVRHGIWNAADIERGFEIAYGVFDRRLRGEAEFAADFF